MGPPSVQLRGPLLLRAPSTSPRRTSVPRGTDLAAPRNGSCVRGLHPHPAFGVLDRAPQALSFLRELLQLQADAMVPLLFRRSSPGPGLEPARAPGGVGPSRGTPRATSESEEGAEKSDQARPAMFGPTTNRSQWNSPRGSSGRGPEDGHRDREHDANVRRYKPSYSRSSFPFPRYRALMSKYPARRTGARGPRSHAPSRRWRRGHRPPTRGNHRPESI